MFAGLQGLDRDRSMKVVGQRNSDGVDVRLFEQLAVIGVAARDVITSAGFAARCGFVSARATAAARWQLVRL
jgi:hypothetical protein